MYIQLTTRCNMTCAHCCYACTEIGEDMSLDTFRNAIEYETEVISLGGGEPTLHPLFYQILGEAIAGVDYVWLATNGSITKTALMLAKLAKRGVIGCALSRDKYHAPIDQDVVDAFENSRTFSGVNRDNNDSREIRNITLSNAGVIYGGRCDFGTKNDCVCSDPMVKPDGTVKGCGCDDAPILGNINERSFCMPDTWQSGECSHDQEEIQ